MTRMALLVLVAFGLYGLTRERPRQELAGVELRLAEVADSQAHFVYSYEMINPAQSVWSIGYLSIDISASAGTPDNLPVTGSFFEMTATAGLPPEEPHAEVGPITPTGWRAARNRTAALSWYPLGGDRLFTPDSVAPGDTLSGFGIRSSYLPGISTVVAEPTYQSCCAVPDTNDVYPGVAQFRVSASTVAPRYMPGEVDLDLLESQAAAVCDDPLWITDASFCTQLADTLDATQDRLGVNNYWGAAAALDSIYTWLFNRQGDPDLHDNAFWLLSLNTDEIYVGLIPQHASPGESTLCAHGPSGTTAYFTVVASGDSLLVTSPHSIVAEVPGVDPEGSSCGKIWDFPSPGTELVDVSVKLDSVTAGRELDEIFIFGYPAGGDTTIAAPQDSILINHDGATVTHITYHLQTSGGP